MTRLRRKSRGRISKDRILREDTPIEDYRSRYRLWVKREDLCCTPPGPHFSKIRGVYRHILNRPEKIIGALDTYHSQAGHAVARICRALGRECLSFYPEYKHEPGPRGPQREAENLGAELIGLPAGRSVVLFHSAKRQCLERGGYMMPNALKLDETVEETVKEVPDQLFDWVIVSASSATIAAGVIRGFLFRGTSPGFLIHLGYSRSYKQVMRYLVQKVGAAIITEKNPQIRVIDEGYSYKDKARPGPTPPWPCNEYYDLKAFRWWMATRTPYDGKVLFWNIG